MTAEEQYKDVAEKIKKIIVERLNLKNVTPKDIEDDMPLFGEGLGLDSVEALEIVVGLEEVFGVSIEGSALYCTNTPCVVCVKMLINAGVKEIIYSGDYPDQLAKDMIEESAIKIKRLK